MLAGAFYHHDFIFCYRGSGDPQRQISSEPTSIISCLRL